MSLRSRVGFTGLASHSSVEKLDCVSVKFPFFGGVGNFDSAFCGDLCLCARPETKV